MASLPNRTRKVAPLHPGAVAADILDEQRIALRPAATAMGMTHSNLDKVLKGARPVTAETALRFAAYFGNSAEHWLGMQADHDLWEARQAIGANIAKIKKLAS